MTHRITRRGFLKSSAALGTAWWIGHHSANSADSDNPLERLNFACIGVGGKGSSDTEDAGRNGNVVALCDIDDRHLAEKKQQFPSAATFNDYREMIDALGDKIDAVTVSTPDHSHACASITAMKKGKHCFTQKPLTWSIDEARRMREVAEEMKVATQMGNQGTASSGHRAGVELIRAGALGNVTEVHVWTDRPSWPQGIARPEKSDPVPKEVHWDLFLGPAPERPYVEGVYHRFNWRGWLDFGTGALGDMGCHIANLPVMALELFDPTSIEVVDTSGIVENETVPQYSVIRWEFPERGELPPCTMVWYDGQKFPPTELFQGQEISPGGSLVVGSEGTLYSGRDQPRERRAPAALLPADKFKDFQRPEPTLPRVEGRGGHFGEFAAACRGGSAAMSNFGYGGRLTETVLLGNLALRAGSRIEWDAKNKRVANLPEASKFLGRDYRDGYSI